MNVADLMRASLVVRTVMLREMVNLAWYLCMAVAALIYMLVIEWRTALTLVGCLALQAAIFVLQSKWLAVQDKEVRSDLVLCVLSVCVCVCLIVCLCLFVRCRLSIPGKSRTHRRAAVARCEAAGRGGDQAQPAQQAQGRLARAEPQ